MYRAKEPKTEEQVPSKEAESKHAEEPIKAEPTTTIKA
jgi:hypothetical protein